MSTPKNQKKEGVKSDPVTTQSPKAKELHTEGPLSEKDEVKKAEDEMNKTLKK